MNKEPQSYWYSEMGIWGSNAVQTYEFGPEHHADLHEAFDLVHDSEVGEFMAYLQARPHERTGSGDEERYCTTCEDLAEQFGVM
jgi:hypothetical protein